MTRSIAALALIAAVFVSACGNPPSPSPSPIVNTTPSPAPSSEPSSASGATACAGNDIQATGGPWGGAAGSRGSDIVVENIGASPCVLPKGTTVALVDQAGSVLLSNTPPAPGAGPELAPGGSIGFSLVMSNWCDANVSLPLHLQVAMAGDSVDIEDLAIEAIDDLPPCNGPGQPATLSTTDWQPL